jgi:hypothetical protein
VNKKVVRPARKPKPRATPRRKPRPKPRATKRARTTKKALTTRKALTKRRPPIDREAVAALESDVRRLRVARRRLEQRLTAAVQEIGMLRQFELRAQMLESQVAGRDAELARLRAENAERLGGASIVSTPAGASN